MEENRKFQNKKPTWIRYLKEIENVLYDRKWAETAEDFPVYYVWRGVEQQGNLRYDITVIPPKMLGKEFPKTKGHKHINNFSELITVLEGEAFYLAQWEEDNRTEVIKADKGDWIIYPPNCHHLTINPSNKELVMANWLSDKCQSDYSFFEKFGGAAYFYTEDGWVKNEKYGKIPEIKFKKPLKTKPENFDFLYGDKR